MIDSLLIPNFDTLSFPALAAVAEAALQAAGLTSVPMLKQGTPFLARAEVSAAEATPDPRPTCYIQHLGLCYFNAFEFPAK